METTLKYHTREEAWLGLTCHSSCMFLASSPFTAAFLKHLRLLSHSFIISGLFSCWHGLKVENVPSWNWTYRLRVTLPASPGTHDPGPPRSFPVCKYVSDSWGSVYLVSNLPVLWTKDNASVYQFCENLTDSRPWLRTFLQRFCKNNAHSQFWGWVC